MGLVVFPGDGDLGSPDVDWSCRGFQGFRAWLAQAEGFDLAEMYGFGGDRLWTSVSTALEPLLAHPDVGGPDLTPAQCHAMLPRLEAIIDQQDGDPAERGHVDDARRLLAVMKLCQEKAVPLLFA